MISMDPCRRHVLLRLVTERLCSCVRETDMVARIGKDEFTVMLENLIDTKYVKVVAEKIFTELKRPFKVFDKTQNS